MDRNGVFLMLVFLASIMAPEHEYNKYQTKQYLVSYT